MRFRIAAKIFLLFSVLVQCGTKPDPMPSDLFSVQLSSTKGETIDLISEKGNVLVLDFWATWCDPCAKAVPVLNKMKSSSSGQRMHFWGINTDSPTNLKEILEKEKKWGMEYPSLLDSEWKIVDRFHIKGQPAMMVFDSKGKEIYRQYGITGTDLPGLLLRAKDWLNESEK